MEEAEKFCALLEPPEPDSPESGLTTSGLAQARTMGRTVETAARMRCFMVPRLFVCLYRFLERNCGFRAHCDELLLDRSGVPPRKHKNHAMIAAIGVREFQREDVDLVRKQAQGPPGSVRDGHRREFGC